MKVPDKLFLHPNYRGEVGANWLTFPLTEKDECYIRKDALLYKLNRALKLRDDGNPNSNTDGVQTIKAMINYIESL